jgi:hypothetical protein
MPGAKKQMPGLAANFFLHKEQIRCVLTDLASGYDKAHVMEGNHPELPQAFLAKPYNIKALFAAISQTMERKKK